MIRTFLPKAQAEALPERIFNSGNVSKAFRNNGTGELDSGCSAYALQRPAAARFGSWIDSAPPGLAPWARFFRATGAAVGSERIATLSAFRVPKRAAFSAFGILAVGISAEFTNPRSPNSP